MRARTWMAGLAAAALAAAGLVGAGTAADAAVTTQPAGVSITVDSTGSNTALVSSPTVANVTVKNNSASATLGVFTIVVPAGVSPGAGRRRPGSRQLAPDRPAVRRHRELLGPGPRLRQPAAEHVGAAPGPVGDVRRSASPPRRPRRRWRSSSSASATVCSPRPTHRRSTSISGVAGSFCVTSPGNLVAGATATFTVQAISDGSECGNVTVKKIGIAATSLTVKFGTDDSQGRHRAYDIVGARPRPAAPTSTFASPASSTGPLHLHRHLQGRRQPVDRRLDGDRQRQLHRLHRLAVGGELDRRERRSRRRTRRRR